MNPELYSLISLLLRKFIRTPQKTPQHGMIAPYQPTGMKNIPVWQEATPRNGSYSAEAMQAFQRPEGMRFYRGLAVDKNPDIAFELAEMDAGRKAYENPADSVRSQNVFTTGGMPTTAYKEILERLIKEPRYMQKNNL